MTTPNIEELRLLAQTLEFSDAVRCSIQRAADLLQSQTRAGYTAKGATMTFLELRAAIINLLKKADNLSAEEVYGIVASVEAEMRLVFETMKQEQKKDTL